MAKITRKAIKEGLEQIPVETILLGVGAKPKLTHKQKEFARHVALGETKAQAYRKAYKSKGTSKTVGDNAHKLSLHTGVQQEIEAYKIALEAEKHRTPAQLKSLLIQQLVKHSLDEDFPPAQRVKCLELMGKLYEVGAFEERKTTTIVHESAKVKERLLSQLKPLIDGDYVKEKTETEEDSLLAELKAAPPGETGDQQPTTPPPALTGPSDGQPTTHINPHIQSAMLVSTSSKSDSQVIDSEGESNVTGTISSENDGEMFQKNEGGGVLNSQDVVLGEDIEMTPLDDLDTMEEGVGDKK